MGAEFSFCHLRGFLLKKSLDELAGAGHGCCAAGGCGPLWELKLHVSPCAPLLLLFLVVISLSETCLL